MNYALNYSGGLIGQSPQRTILLAQGGGQACPTSVNGTMNNQQSQAYPMVMQVGGNTAPVFYTYPSSKSMPKTAIGTKNNDSSSPNNSGLGPVLLSPVSPMQSGIIHSNTTSPTVPAAVSIRADTKPSVSEV